MALPHGFAQSHQHLATGSTKSFGHGTFRAPAPVATFSDEVAATLQDLFQQIEQSLTVLRGLAGIVLIGSAAIPSGQSLHARLHPNARQAEAAMHDLRALGLLTSPALTDLSQHLTVLVLAADMLGNGQLSGSDTLVFYDLLMRNAENASRALDVLRSLAGFDLR